MESSAAQTAAAELCDNPTVAARTLATPSDAEMAAAREALNTGGGADAVDAGGWAYAVWGKADKAVRVQRGRRGPWNGGRDGRVRGGGWAGDRSSFGDEEEEDDEDEDEEYVVRPGDAVWYEIKWRGAEAVDPDDPVAGSNPTRADAGDREDREDADGWNASGGTTDDLWTSSDDLWTSSDDLLSDFADDSAPAFVALDVECDDGTRLSRTDALDDRGLYANPRVDLRGAARRFGESGWLHRRVAFPREFWGKKLARWAAGCEAPAGTTTRASVRNVRVVGADGREVFAALPSHGRPRVISDGDES